MNARSKILWNYAKLFTKKTYLFLKMIFSLNFFGWRENGERKNALFLRLWASKHVSCQSIDFVSWSTGKPNCSDHQTAKHNINMLWRKLASASHSKSNSKHLLWDLLFVSLINFKWRTIAVVPISIAQTSSVYFAWCVCGRTFKWRRTRFQYLNRT